MKNKELFEGESEVCDALSSRISEKCPCLRTQEKGLVEKEG